MRYIWFIVLLLAANIASAAEIYGAVYDLYLEKQPDVRISINTTPVQYYISKDASYSFFLNQGSYSIIAEYYADYELKSTAEENITVTQEGSYVLDLILFPSISADLDELELEIEQVDDEGPNYFYYYLLSGLVFLLVVFYVFHINKRFKRLKQKDSAEEDVQKKEDIFIQHEQSTNDEKDIKYELKIEDELFQNAEIKTENEIQENEQKELTIKDSEKTNYESIEKEQTEQEEIKKHSNELDELLHFIKQKDGRVSQKEIRKRFPSSEAKISLMLTELENKGLVEKIKKGRSNVIILK